VIAELPFSLKKLTFLLLTVVAPLALADSGVWGERGIVGRLAVRAPYLFEADGRGVSVYDVSTNDPRRIGIAPTADESLDVAVSDDLYVITRGEIDRLAVADNGVLTLKATIPGSDYRSIVAGDGYIATLGATRLKIWSTAQEMPVVVAEIEPPGTVTAYAFHDSQLWVAVRDQAIYGYDITQGAQPLGMFSANAQGLAFRGDTLFAAAGVDGLIIADVSDAANPTIISRTGAGELNLIGLVATADRVYAPESVNIIDVFDVSDPEAPKQLASIHDYAQSLATDGARLFAGGEEVDSFGLIHVTPLRFSVYANGVRAGGFSDTLGGPVTGVATDGTFAYVIDWPYFRVMDVSTPSQIKLLTSITFPDIQDHVKIHDGFAIVWGRGKLNLVDIHDPWHPKFLGTFDSLGMPFGGATFANDIIIEANPQTGMHVLDFFQLTTPDKPVQIGGVIWHYYELVSYFPAVYMFDINTIRIADVSNPFKTHAVREVPIPHGAAAVVTNDAGPAHLVVQSTDRFHILDLTDPFNPIEVGGLPLLPSTGVLATDGDGVLIARAGEVDRLDISNPAHPEMSKTAMTAVAPAQIAVGGGKVVIADRYQLRVYGSVTPAPQEPPAIPARLRPSRR